MVRYLIIDDESIAHEIIESYCDKLAGMQLMKHCYDAFEALEYLRQNPVDLIFLDLNMPKLKGFDFLRTLPHLPKVIVTTAYQEYALEGYELEVSDYLLKPFSFERFLKAVNKATQVKENASTSVPPASQSKKEFAFFYSDKRHVQVRLDAILYVEAAGNYAKVIMSDGHLLVREKISDILRELPSEHFLQVHKSFLVAKGHISSIEGNRIFIGESAIPIGSLYKAHVMEQLQLKK